MRPTKHTPGPWSYRNGYSTNGELHVRGEDCRTIGFAPLAKVLGDVRLVDEETRAANARLIASAPELLAALQSFVVEYVAMVNSGDCGFWNPEDEDKVKAARAAIAKATA